MREGKVLLLANPAAQSGNGAQAAQIAQELLSQWLGDSMVDFALTEQPAHATRIASEASSEKYGTVIALGGDGLVHETVNGLMMLPSEKRPSFGLIPVGSGNDYAKTLGMTPCVPDAVVQFLEASLHHFDVGCCNGEYFAETLSFGLDAAIALDTVERRKKTGKQGTPLYLASGLNQLLYHLDTFDVRAVLDKGRTTIEGPVHMFAVQIGPTYGGGFRICPDADPEDGLFDICYATAPMGRIEATYKFLSAKDGKHVKRKGIHFERASSLEITFDCRPPCQIDGEALVANGYHISLEPRALEVLVAQDSPFVHCP